MATEIQMIEAQEARQRELERQRKERAQAAQREREARQRAARQEALERNQQEAQQSEEERNSETTAEAAENAEKSEQERGPLTQLGEAASYALNLGFVPDALNAAASGLNTASGGNLQALDDFVLSYDEEQESRRRITEAGREAREAGELDPVTSALTQTNEALAGVAGGMESAILTPFTVAARIGNQDSSEWAEPPAELKGNAVAESLFEITRVVTATALTAGAASGLGAGAVVSGTSGLAVESAIETTTQRSADDVLFGRTLARSVGDVADHLGYDGSQLTRDMIEGNKPHAQAITAVVGFLVNMGINVSADQLFSIIGRSLPSGKPKPTEAVEAVAERTGKNADDVQASINNTTEPVDQAVGTKEPFELETIDNQVPVSKPSPGRTAINDEAIQAQALRGANLADDVTVVGGRNYFTNYSVFGDDYTAVLREATEALEPLVSKAADRDRILTSASQYLENFRLAEDAYDLDQATASFRDLTRTIDDTGSTGGVPQTIEETLESSAPTPTGMVVATVLGEEFGARLMRAARRASNLDSKGIDFKAAVETFIELSEKSHHVLVPLRRGKRVWSVTGDVQQRAIVEQAGKEFKPSGAAARAANAPASEYIFADNGRTVRQLWDAAQNGDEAALTTLKNHMHTLAYSPPSTALQESVNAAKTLSEQLRLGNTGATTQLYYSSMLTRLSPMNAALFSNLAQAIKQPIGSLLTGNKSFALGQFYGGMSAISDAFQATVRTFRDGVSINSGSKLDMARSTAGRVKAQKELDDLWTGAQREIAERGGNNTEMFAAWLQYQRKSLANNDFMTAAGRLLNGIDEGGKVMLASQEAAGRAFQEAASRGIKPGSKEWKEITTRHMNNVFKGGVRNGRIQEDVLDQVKYLTFQSPIPKDGNMIDQAFYTLNQAANSNPVWRWVSPFTRASYTMLEQTGVYMAGTLPGGGQLLATAIPRYRHLLNPKGPLSAADLMASRQLKGTLATAKMTGLMGVGLGYSGFMTGQHPPEGMPKQSFLIPANNKDGYIAISYARLEPFATQFSLMADIGHMQRIGVLDNKQYERAVTEILSSIFFSTIDKSFLTGMGDVASLLDIRNFNSGKTDAIVNNLAALVGAAGAGGTVALTRMVTSAGDPSKGISRVSQSGDDLSMFWESIGLSMNQRFFSGAGNPDMHDPLFGGKVNRGIETGNWFTNVALGIAQEGLSPGRIAGGRTSYVTETFDVLGYDRDFTQTLREYRGVALTAEEQSILSRDLHEVAGLHRELEYFMQNDRTFTQLLSEYERSPSEEIRTRLTTLLNGRVRRSIDVAVGKGELASNVEFQDRVAERTGDMYSNFKIPTTTQTQQPNSSTSVDNLINMPK